MDPEMNHTNTDMDHPVQSTNGISDDEMLFTTTTDDMTTDYQALVEDSVPVSEISGAELAGVMTFIGVYLAFMLILFAISIVSMWKVFTKAGRAGWESIVPIYNIYVNLLIVGRPGWWLLLFFVPFVNVVIVLILAIDMAKSFGRSTAFGVIGLFLFSLVGYAILAFSSDKYIGPAGSHGATYPDKDSQNPTASPPEPESPPATTIA